MKPRKQTVTITPAVSDYYVVTDKFGMIQVKAYYEDAAFDAARLHDNSDPERGPHAVFHYAAKLVRPKKGKR